MKVYLLCAWSTLLLLACGSGGDENGTALLPTTSTSSSAPPGASNTASSMPQPPSASGTLPATNTSSVAEPPPAPDASQPPVGSSSTPAVSGAGGGAGGTDDSNGAAGNGGIATGGGSDDDTGPGEPAASASSDDTSDEDGPGDEQSSGEDGPGDDMSGAAGATDDAGTPPGEASGCVVQPLSDEFRSNYDNLDPFYTKYADAAGLPVVSSDAPSDMALIRVCELVIDMTMRADVRAALIENHVRFAVIGNDELTNDIPEYSYLDDSINERARGLGGLPAASCAEESILCDTTRDRWRGEGICVHEFAHTISLGGLFEVERDFEDRLDAAFENAQTTGLFEDTYAMENAQEYWAEGVQSWYFTNLESDPPNGIHNDIDRREELLDYDPILYDLVAEFLPEPLKFVDCYSDE